MPFKSEAQRKKMKQLVVEGKITQATYDEFERASQGLSLPDRAPSGRPAKITNIKKVKVLK